MKLQAFESLSPVTNMSKKDLVALAETQGKEIIESGDSVVAFAFIKKIETLLKTLKDAIKDDAVTLVGRGEDRALGMGLKIKSKPDWKYDKDQTWVEIKERLEAHQKFLQSIKVPTSVVDEATGEVIEYHPAYKVYSKDFLEAEF